MFCNAYAIHGTCPHESATHFSGHIHVYIIYISACAGMSNSMVHVSVGVASLAQLMYALSLTTGEFQIHQWRSQWLNSEVSMLWNDRE